LACPVRELLNPGIPPGQGTWQAQNSRWSIVNGSQQRDKPSLAGQAATRSRAFMALHRES